MITYAKLSYKGCEGVSTTTQFGREVESDESVHGIHETRTRDAVWMGMEHLLFTIYTRSSMDLE